MAKSARSNVRRYANEAFSIYIRTRDAIRTTNTTTGFRCVTCGNYTAVKGGHCGHFIPGRGDAVLDEEHNAHGQCPKCNTFGSGMWIEHEAACIELYGEDEVARLKQLKFQVRKYSIQDFKDIREEYKEKLKSL